MKCDYKLELNYKGIKREFIIPSLDADLMKTNEDVLEHVRGELHSTIEGNSSSHEYISSILDYIRDVDNGLVPSNPVVKESVNNYIADKGIDFNALRNHVSLSTNNKYAPLIKELISPLKDDEAPGIQFALADSIDKEFTTREYDLADIVKDNKGKVVTVKFAKFDKSFKATVTGDIKSISGKDEIAIRTATGKVITAHLDEITGLINQEDLGKTITVTSPKENRQIMGKSVYDRVTNSHKIILYTDNIPNSLDILKDETIGKTLAHELIHFRIDKNIASSQFDSANNKFTNPDLEILRQMKDYFVKNAPTTNTYKNNPQLQLLIDGIERSDSTISETKAKHTLREFIAYSMTEPLIQQAMSEITVKGLPEKNNTLLDTLTGWASKSLEITPKAKTLLNSFYNASVELLDVNKNPETIYYDSVKGDIKREEIKKPEVVETSSNFAPITEYKKSTKKETFQKNIADPDGTGGSTIMKNEEGYLVTFKDHPNFTGHIFKNIAGDYMFIESKTGFMITTPHSTPNTIKGTIEGAITRLNDVIESSNSGKGDHKRILNSVGISKEGENSSQGKQLEIPHVLPPTSQPSEYKGRFKPFTNITRDVRRVELTLPDVYKSSDLEQDIKHTTSGYNLTFENHPNIDAALVKSEDNNEWMIIDKKTGLAIVKQTSPDRDALLKDAVETLNKFVDDPREALIKAYEKMGASKTGSDYNPKSRNSQSFIKSTDDIIHVKLLTDRLRDLYDLNFRLLNSKDIAEEYDGVYQYSKDRAFLIGKDIVINTDLASMAEPLHELGHVVLAGIKSSDPELYEEILNKVQSHPRYNDIASTYPELQGQDLNEEVFTTIFGEKYRNVLKSRDQIDWEKDNKSFFQKVIDNVKEFFKRLFNISSPLFDDMEQEEVANLSLEDVIGRFGDKMMDGYLKNYVDIYTKGVDRYMTDFKQKLKDLDILKIECYG